VCSSLLPPPPPETFIFRPNLLTVATVKWRAIALNGGRKLPINVTPTALVSKAPTFPARQSSCGVFQTSRSNLPATTQVPRGYHSAFLLSAHSGSGPWPMVLW